MGRKGDHHCGGGGPRLGAQRLAAALGVDVDVSAKLLQAVGRKRPALALAAALGVSLPEARALLDAARGGDATAREVIHDVLRAAAAGNKAAGSSEDGGDGEDDAVLVDAMFRAEATVAVQAVRIA